MLTKAFPSAGPGRPATCEDCGASYTQIPVPRQFKIWAALVASRDGNEVSALDRELPDGWTPLHCPACERERIRRDDPAPADPMFVRTYAPPRRAAFGDDS